MNTPLKPSYIMLPVPDFHGSFQLDRCRVLVTGGAGFIGSHLVDYLVEKKAATVRVVDNLSTGSLQNIEHHIKKGSITFLEDDLSVAENCERAVENIDVVFHQAALGSIPRSVAFPEATHQANVNGFFHLLDASRKAGVQKFIYASSSSVFGDNVSFPRPEEALGNPLSPYAVSKRINELYGQIYHRVYGIHTTGLRYFNIFGPRQNPEGAYAAAIPRFLLSMSKGEKVSIFGDGKQTRDFTFVTNAVQANILAMISEGASGEIFNIGMGRETSLLELVNLLRSMIRQAPEPDFATARKGDVARSMAEISKAKKLLGYEPFVDFKTGLQETVKWFLQS